MLVDIYLISVNQIKEIRGFNKRKIEDKIWIFNYYEWQFVLVGGLELSCAFGHAVSAFYPILHVNP